MTVAKKYQYSPEFKFYIKHRNIHLGYRFLHLFSSIKQILLRINFNMHRFFMSQRFKHYMTSLEFILK